MHHSTVIRLNLHLPNDQIVYFRGDMDEQEVDRAREAARGTKLLAFFQLCTNDN